MDLRDTRHITLQTSNGYYLVPTFSQGENTADTVKVKFTFQRDFVKTEFDYVIADNEQGFVRMVTSTGEEFATGSLFDQLFIWYNYILKN
ncbi:hypothetical protein [Mucilaginibacter sp. AK015]|uniref:hypothetical protein n=1 Tax=Mucilaginibacter sp. AK015 TaxID=2723072 RepID=UPI001621A80E|nr:hypothetical protein [Mucilaginibacter sp. AK015]MBB5395884.1 hypothetical protein [Mucilaginibacter sp. AK015]